MAIVDDDDYDELSKYKWYTHTVGMPYTKYACRTTKINGKKKTFWMHRVINKTPDNLLTDHINGNGLDNRKENLRSVTHQENMDNSKINNLGISKLRGVSWHSSSKKWRAHISINNKYKHIGVYDTKIEAHKAYNEARENLRGNKIKQR